MMSNKLNKVNEPIRILRKINKDYITGSVIAGGYYRDIYHNREFNDIDIFVHTNNSHSKYIKSDAYTTDFWAEVFDLNMDSFWSGDSIEEMEPDDSYDQLNDMDMVFELVKAEVKYNIVLVDLEPVEYVNDVFDFGICKAYCDGTKVTFTKDFISDAENKTLTFTNKNVSADSFCYSMNSHLKKLMVKFPTHQVYIPERYMQHLHLLPNELRKKIKTC